jgi:hypothetical protein
LLKMLCRCFESIGDYKSLLHKQSPPAWTNIATIYNLFDTYPGVLT